MSLRDGDPYRVPSVSVLFSGKRILGAEEAGSGDRTKCGTVPEVRGDALYGDVSQGDTDTGDDGAGAETGKRTQIETPGREEKGAGCHMTAEKYGERWRDLQKKEEYFRNMG